MRSEGRTPRKDFEGKSLYLFKVFFPTWLMSKESLSCRRSEIAFESDVKKYAYIFTPLWYATVAPSSSVDGDNLGAWILPDSRLLFWAAFDC